MSDAHAAAGPPAGGVPPQPVAPAWPAPPAQGYPGVPAQPYPPVWGGPPVPPGYPGAPGPAGWPVVYAGPRNGAGTAAFVLGVVAASLCWTFSLSAVALVLGVLAVVFGCLGVARARRGTATNRGMALGGLWTGAGAAVVAAVLTVLFVVWAVRPTQVESEAGAGYLAGAEEEVVFADGLVVTMDAPEFLAEDGEYAVTVRVVNDGDDPVELAGSGFRAAIDGTRVDPGTVWLENGWPDGLSAGGSIDVVYRVGASGGGEYLSVDFAPGEDHEFGFWDLELPAGGGSPDDGGGDSGGSGGDGVDV